MLEHTFLHISGIGEATERRLWKQGILTWQDALACPGTLPKRCRLLDLEAAVRDSVGRLQAEDAYYFHLRLPSGERWRLFREFANRAVCLDIETTGISYGPDCITVIGLHDGQEYKPFIRGQNLHQFASEIRRYDLVITYNGQRFDVPFIEWEMGPVLEGLAHLDVMYPLRRLGYRGGLKGVEGYTGLSRPSSLCGLDGYDAVRLWNLHQRGHRGALETLVRYNAEDVASLLPLSALSYNLLAQRLPISLPPLPACQRPSLDLPYDGELVEWLKQDI